MNLKASISAAYVAAAVWPTSVSCQDKADAIYFGGPIYTMSDAAPRVEALAVKDRRILAVGTSADMDQHKGAGTQVHDLEGRTLIPGFVDGHGHIFIGGVQALSANLLPPPDGPNNDIPTLLQSLTDWASANEDLVQKVKLIIGFGYDNAQLKELRHPTRDDLDKVSMDLPIVIVHQSGHLGVLNSKALEVAGYSAQSTNPEGGVIQRRDGSQEPNGVLEEAAFFAVVPKILGAAGPAGMEVLSQAGAEMWSKFGYTTAQEGRSSPPVVKAMKAVAERDGFKIDVATYPDVLVDRDMIKSGVSPTYTKHFRIAGAKLTIDGSPQGFTALRDRPYYAPVGNYPPGYLGYAAVKMEDVTDAIDWAYANDIQIITHANGEGASDMLIAGIKAAQSKHGTSALPPVLVHGQFEREDQVDSFKALGVFPSLFPMHTFYWGDWHRDHTVGPENADNISPTGWFLKRGMVFSSHHDAPVALPDSMRVLFATVTRRSRSRDIIGPAHRVPVMDALKAMTLWPAQQYGEERAKGSLEPGKVADLVILSDDPVSIDPDKIAEIEVMETIKDGNSVYEAPPGGKKKAMLDWPSRRYNHALHEMFKQVYIMQRMERIPVVYRTAELRAAVDETFDACMETEILADIMSNHSEGHLTSMHQPK